MRPKKPESKIQFETKTLNKKLNLKTKPLIIQDDGGSEIKREGGYLRRAIEFCVEREW